MGLGLGWEWGMGFRDRPLVVGAPMFRFHGHGAAVGSLQEMTLL